MKPAPRPSPGGRWPLRLLIAGALVAIALRLAGGLLLDRIVARESRKPHASRELLELLVVHAPLLFGYPALPALERIVEEQPRLAVEAYTAIARLSPGRADRLLDERSLSAAQAEWWRPPRADEERRAALAAQGASEDGCLLRDREGERLVVFSHGYLGGRRDLWLDRPERPAGEALFIGTLLGDEYRYSDLVLRCSEIDSEVIELAWHLDGGRERGVGEPAPAVLWLPELAQDSDADGLTDRVEKRLLTDPRARDTDGDGIEDLVDLSPNGRASPEPGSRDAAGDELVRTLFAFGDQSCRWRTVLYLVSERRIERWARACGPTVGVTAEESAALPEGVDLTRIEPFEEGWLARFGPKTVPPGGPGNLAADLVGSGDLALLLVNQHIGSDSEGWEVRMRRRGGRWRLVWIRNLWY